MGLFKGSKKDMAHAYYHHIKFAWWLSRSNSTISVGDVYLYLVLTVPFDNLSGGRQ